MPVASISRLNKAVDKDKPCSDLVADGRHDNLTNHIHLIEVGFEINDNFHKTIEVCHDDLVQATLWTKHQLRGQSIQFQDPIINAKMIEGSSNFEVQLSPMEDFIMEWEQSATSLAINEVPKAQDFNLDHWRHLEKALRRTAAL